MSYLPLGLVMVEVVARESRSAFPDAPVIEPDPVRPPRLYRTRFTAASVLRRTAARVAPA